MHPRTYVIWGDNQGEAEWFRTLDSRLKGAEVRMIGRRGSNGEVVDALVSYDRPDIILTCNEIPVLVLEKTREVPTGHNIGQRVARLVRSAEHQIPTLYFLPFDARKHGKHTGICHINVRLFQALNRMSEIHDCPVLAVNWPADSNGELIHDGTENEQIARVVEEVIGAFPLKVSKQLRKEKSELESEMERRVNKNRRYGAPPASVQTVDTSLFLASPRFGDCELGDLTARKESMVYTMNMSPDKCHRQDPYTGMQFVYDYAYLRHGPTPKDRLMNLFIDVPQVSLSRWQSENPNDPSTKSCNWYLTADAILLKDGFLRIKHG
jgi:hypothetical protein